jgi:hypothetical protein
MSRTFAPSTTHQTSTARRPATQTAPVAVTAPLRTGRPTVAARFDFSQIPVSVTSGPVPAIQYQKLVNEPGDIYEQEADGVANTLMKAPRTSAGPLRSLGKPSPARIQRKCAACEHEKNDDEALPQVQRKATASPTEKPDGFEDRVRSLSGGGTSLPDVQRQEYETHLGYDLSGVRVHTDSSAATAAASVCARAFTHGRDIAFATGQYAPETPVGRQLLAHELTHVVQQSTGGLIHGKVTGNTPAPVQRAPIDTDEMQQKVPETKGSALEAVSRAMRILKEKVNAARDYIGRKLQTARKSAGEKAREGKEFVANKATAAKGTAEDGITEVQKKVQDLKQQTTVQIEKAKSVVRANVKSSVNATKRAASDSIMDNAGIAKGIVLEAATLVDTVLWLGYQVLKSQGLAQETGPHLTQDHGDLSDGTAIQSVANKDAMSTKDKAPEIAGVLSEKLDKLAESLQSKLDATPNSEAMLFTPYELGELKGAIGAQVALATIGAEEAQLVIKIIGVVGGIKGLFENPNWRNDPAFWTGLINLALSLVGLNRAASAKKIIQIAMHSGLILNAVPPVLKLYDAMKDPELAKDPEKRHKKIAEASHDLILVLKDIVMAIIESGRAKSAVKPEGGDPAGGPQVIPDSETAKVPVPVEQSTEKQLGPQTNPDQTPLPQVATLAESTTVPKPVSPDNVIPITRARKPATPSKLQPGERPVTDLAEVRARKQSTSRDIGLEPTTESHVQPAAHAQEIDQVVELQMAAVAENVPLPVQVASESGNTSLQTVASAGGGRKSEPPTHSLVSGREQSGGRERGSVRDGKSKIDPIEKRGDERFNEDPKASKALAQVRGELADNLSARFGRPVRVKQIERTEAGRGQQRAVTPDGSEQLMDVEFVTRLNDGSEINVDGLHFTGEKQNQFFLREHKEITAIFEESYYSKAHAKEKLEYQLERYASLAQELADKGCRGVLISTNDPKMADYLQQIVRESPLAVKGDARSLFVIIVTN